MEIPPPELQQPADDRAGAVAAERRERATLESAPAGSAATVNRTAVKGAAADRPGADHRATGAAPEPRQRWRITFARDEVPADRAGRPLLDDWHEAVRASSLPVAMVDGEAARPKLAFAAPLPAAARGAAELVDLWLVERLPLWRVRQSLANRLPEGHRWIDAEDIWLGAPPLPGQVAAAEWRVGIVIARETMAGVADAARALLASASLRRTRAKGGASRTYDLRPLIAHIAIEADPDPAVRVVTRFDPALGTGRPDEVVAALAEQAGVPIELRWMVRERLLLNEPPGGPASPSSGAIRPRRPRR